MIGALSPVAAGLSVGLAAIGPGIGQGQAAASFIVESWNLRCWPMNPAADEASFAFMESLCIYGLVIALAILFANPSVVSMYLPLTSLGNLGCSYVYLEGPDY